MTGSSLWRSLFLFIGFCGCASQTQSDAPNVQAKTTSTRSATITENGETQAMTAENATSALAFTVKDIDGNDVFLPSIEARLC